MNKIKYNKRKWHIVEVNGYYALRKVSWLGTNWYLSKYSEFEYRFHENVIKYCLHPTLELAEKRLSEINKSKEQEKIFKNPTFIKQ